MAKSSFKLEHDFEKRRLEAARIREKYPDRIPKIIRPIDSRLSYHFRNSADSQRMFAVSLLPEKIIPRFLPN
ncbi:Autophagy-related protein 8f [Platanthera guangdongensis]|uniref:Autophagy-related protein 8f n=1 Tax=Platanthera guangdongensis TaxID=2320717 RepID=A0ABR2LN98_9ASPA